MVVRGLEGIASACFMTASFAIVSSVFPNSVSTMIAKIFNGLGFSLGPPIGGALYEVGNFIMPFAVLSVLLLIAGVLAIPLVPKNTGQT
ncbi:unnamed protein product [Soboliphyme baturini]|uniref:MFS domain-containing protein n=1 Tax=Soboliphyme baturini TaxID=241478 RepID=A0A183J4J8_9BILA|nr:unnamed protein product [Soboliphyme baturini]